MRLIYSVVSIFSPLVVSYCGSENQNKWTAHSYPVDSVIYNGLISDCGCNSENICARKCCGLNYVLDNQTCILSTAGKFKKLPIYKNGYPLEDNSVLIRFVPGMVKCVIADPDAKETLKQFLPERNPEDDGNVQSDGRLWISSSNAFYNHDDYCVDDSEEFGLIFSVCISNTQPPLTVTDYLYIVGTMLSLPFLLATFIVYALLPERNLHAMCLMSHVFALLVAYGVTASLVFFRGTFTSVSGKATIMTILCCFMASIFWVNLMAFDICSTFSGTRSHATNKKQQEQRRFIIYNFYAWGIPLMFIALVMILSNTVTPNVWYDPGVRGSENGIRSGLPTLLYYYGPLAILILSNIVMFIITACKIRGAQKDTAMLSKRGSKKHGPRDTDKQLFQLYVRLLFAMGVNWAVEIIAWFVDWQVGNVPRAVWYVSDFCNAAYGIVVFILFVCKKNIWKALKKRYYKVVGKKETEFSVTASSLMT